MDDIKLILGTMTIGESVNGLEAEEFLNLFITEERNELDTAYVYNDGECERILGHILEKYDRNSFKIATKVNPRITGRLDAEAANLQVNESLGRLHIDKADIVYLHFPDSHTPIRDVLKEMNRLHEMGKYGELGLSNFPAWLVADVCHICEKNRWIVPSVFEGIYNPITRKAEAELDKCLSYYGLRFNAYNPLAGGLLTGKYDSFTDKPTEGRFTNRPNYLGRYWKKSNFDSIRLLKKSLQHYDISLVEATFRWLMHSSMLKKERGDAIILGASKIDHLKENIEFAGRESLPEEIVDAFNVAWDACKGDSPEYFTFYR